MEKEIFKKQDANEYAGLSEAEMNIEELAKARMENMQLSAAELRRDAMGDLNSANDSIGLEVRTFEKMVQESGISRKIRSILERAGTLLHEKEEALKKMAAICAATVAFSSPAAFAAENQGTVDPAEATTHEWVNPDNSNAATIHKLADPDQFGAASENSHESNENFAGGTSTERFEKNNNSNEANFSGTAERYTGKWVNPDTGEKYEGEKIVVTPEELHKLVQEKVDRRMQEVDMEVDMILEMTKSKVDEIFEKNKAEVDRIFEETDKELRKMNAFGSNDNKKMVMPSRKDARGGGDIDARYFEGNIEDALKDVEVIKSELQRIRSISPRDEKQRRTIELYEEYLKKRLDEFEKKI